MTRPRSICVFCGSAFGNDPSYEELAQDFGAAIGRAGLRLIYGGGDVGLMGATAHAAMDAGGRVLGIIPECLMRAEIASDRAELVVVRDMHARKKLMADQADAFAVLPGGVGTLEEAVEVLSWARIALHAKPMVFIDADGYWDAFFALIEHSMAKGFTPPAMRRLLLRARSAREALAVLGAMRPQAA